MTKRTHIRYTLHDGLAMRGDSDEPMQFRLEPSGITILCAYAVTGETMNRQFFESVEGVALDPIMSLDAEYREDDRPGKINLVVGVYQNDEGVTPVLETVQTVEKILAENSPGKVYAPMLGETSYVEAAQALVFDGQPGSSLIGRVASVHTPGGTAALRLAGEFVNEHFDDPTVWISDPAYPNHRGIMSSLGLRCRNYQYFDKQSGHVKFDALLSDLQEAKSGDLVILHGCCHNPSGADLSIAQWSELTDFLCSRSMIPLVDLAYLGFAESVANDSLGIHTLFARCPEGLVSTSFSKNFGLYGERTGLLTFVAENRTVATRCAEKTRSYIRRMYSSPPVHGGRVVSAVLGDAGLRTEWEREVSAMRKRLAHMRQQFACALMDCGVDVTLFPRINELKGMFALTRLAKNHVARLRGDHGVYMLPNGRMSVAGLQTATIPFVADAVASVLAIEV